ncbi:MAG: electron transfer flavoprotein subunit beta/FixA family protein [Chitinophagales bacterium]|nr:electron transfer flavoprotein subunit beta/FixA family protein [Chitinophagales bacterium]MDW8273955.1 electron transfer flavoprotein subunit beta/FixA family protein [Chitinophagales bacterium]
MKVLVPIAKVPDTTSKISFVENNTKFNTDGVTFIMNPTDEWYALTRAIELKETGKATEVIVMSVGGADYEPIIRKALAIGADRAVRVDAEPVDAFFVATQIAEYVKNENIELVITGKETIDYNSFQVGGMVAELLDWPAFALVNKLELNGKTATVTREIEGGTETAEASLPLVICATKDLAQARIPNMKGIMSAKTKPLQVLPPKQVETRTRVISYALPEKSKQVKLVSPDNIAELIRLLHEEAKVI